MSNNLMEKEVKILKALANSKRLQILDLLQRYKTPLGVGEISREINLHFKSTSKHLQKLAEAGLVFQYRDGKWTRQKLNKKVDQLLRSIKKLIPS